MTFSVNGRNLILLIAKKDIKKDEELKYNFMEIIMKQIVFSDYKLKLN